MFDISWSEFFLTAAVALIVVGPNEMPALLRNVGKGLKVVNKFANDFKKQFDDLLEMEELKEMKSQLEGEITDAKKRIKGDDGEFYEAYDVSELKDFSKINSTTLPQFRDVEIEGREESQEPPKSQESPESTESKEHSKHSA